MWGTGKFAEISLGHRVRGGGETAWDGVENVYKIRNKLRDEKTEEDKKKGTSLWGATKRLIRRSVKLGKKKTIRPVNRLLKTGQKGEAITAMAPPLSKKVTKRKSERAVSENWEEFLLAKNAKAGR